MTATPQRLRSNLPRLARRKGMTVRIHHPKRRPFTVRCPNVHVARAFERELVERELELQALPVPVFAARVRQTLERIDAAMWQAQKRVRGTRTPRFGGGYA